MRCLKYREEDAGTEYFRRNAMFCSKCGTELMKDARFCFHCGAEVRSVLDATKGYSSYWSRMYYGKDSNYIEYKGCIYCTVPVPELTGKGLKSGYDSSSLTEWAIIRIRISDGSVEEIKRFQEEDRPLDCSFFRCINRIPFSIYDDVLYYFRDCSDYSNDRWWWEIISIDINTKKELPVKSVSCKNLDDYGMQGVFKSHIGVVYIQWGYNNLTGTCSTYMINLEGQKKKLIEGRIDIEAFNDQYIYYRYEDGDENQLFRINLDTFEVTDLSKKLKNMQNGCFYGVDPINDLVYIKEYTEFDEPDKLVSINVENKIVEELTVPKLPDNICLSDAPRVRQSYTEISRASDWFGQAVFFNGQLWVIKVNPEDVDIGAMAGFVVYDKTGRRIGGYMRCKKDSYISRNEMRFVLPTALAIRYKIVKRENPAAGEAKEDWLARLFYLPGDDVINSKFDFHYGFN